MSERTQPKPAVLELQARAQTARIAPGAKKARPSRAARLHLVDILSRWAGSGLALFAGVTVFAAVAAGRSHPFRAALWTMMVLATLIVARRMLMSFRAGGKSSSHPFRWRADYTSALAILSAAFGAGALILVPGGADAAFAHRTHALLIFASLAAGVIHAAHGRAALAAWLPAFAFIVPGVLKTGGGDAVWGVGAAFATGAAALFFFHSYLRHKITRRFPRTGVVRRGIAANVADGLSRGDARPAAAG
jgi:hypothetical protein